MVQNSFNVSTIADYQRMVVTGYTSVTLPDTIDTFIINVLLDNNTVKYNNIPSSVFGNNTTCFLFFTILSGFLGPVTNISSSIDNCSNISITWVSPRVDDYRISIQHYILRICDNITGITVKNVSVYDTSYQFEDEDLFIHRYTYVITGVNELGEGISNKNTFSYQRGIIVIAIIILIIASIIVPRSAIESTFEILNFTRNLATVKFNIPVSICSIFCCFILILGNIRVYW